MSACGQAGRAFGPGPRRAVAGLLAAAGVALAGAGCGSSQATTRTAAGSRSAAARRPRGLKAREAALHRQVLAALHKPDHARYGGIPKDLRDHQTPPPDQILSASVERPAGPIQGVSVRVTLPSGARALVTTVGPDVPDRDQGSFRQHTDATWAVTFAAVQGRLPIRSGTFTITDEQGQTLTPRLTTRSGARAPARIPEGRPFTLVLHARTSIGTGEVRYATSAGKLLVEWNFDAETD